MPTAMIFGSSQRTFDKGSKAPQGQKSRHPGSQPAAWLTSLLAASQLAFGEYSPCWWAPGTLFFLSSPFGFTPYHRVKSNLDVTVHDALPHRSCPARDSGT